MRREEIVSGVKEDTTQARLEIGECMGSVQPHVQQKLLRALDCLERIDRRVEHGVNPGEAPPRVAPGVPPDMLAQNRDDATRQNRNATTAEVRAARRPGDTDVKSRGEASPEAQREAAKAEATKSVKAPGDKVK